MMRCDAQFLRNETICVNPSFFILFFTGDKKMTPVITPYWACCREIANTCKNASEAENNAKKTYESYKSTLSVLHEEMRNMENALFFTDDDQRAAEMMEKLFELQKKRNDMEEKTNELLLVLYMLRKENLRRHRCEYIGNNNIMSIYH